ncbi:MAG: NADPH-dependent FMN reductase [Paracoccaceae bacterium]
MPHSRIRLFGLSGSPRAASVNHRLLSLAAVAESAIAVEAVGAFPMPLYNPDKEHDIPTGALDLRDRIAAADGVVLASPEHNSAPSAALKNAIDWLSRLPGEERVFAGKRVLLLSASPGKNGGRRGLRQLREILTGLGAEVAQVELSVPKADDTLTAAQADPAHSLHDELAGVLRAFRSEIPTPAIV